MSVNHNGKFSWIFTSLIVENVEIPLEWGGTFRCFTDILDNYTKLLFYEHLVGSVGNDVFYFLFNFALFKSNCVVFNDKVGFDNKMWSVYADPLFFDKEWP